MKIFELTPYIYYKGIKPYERNKTGFGIVIKDIIWGLSRSNDIILATNMPYKKKHIENVNILNFNFIKIFLYIFSIQFISNIRFLKKQYNKISLRDIYYCALASFFCHFIKKHKNEFDIVHMHGICLVNELLLQKLNKIKIPTVLTLHGLISDAYDPPKELIQQEQNMLSTCETNSNTVSVVSSGVKDKILKHYNNIKCKVIYNGTDIPKELISNKTTDYYQLVAIGNISPLKNQIQIIDALQYINPKILKKIKLKIIGGYSDISDFENKIKKLKLEKNVDILGFVNKDEINTILETTNLNVLASINEGFGMSIIESLSYGIPSVFFDSIDISKDIDDKMCVKVSNRSSKELAKCIELGLTKEWNREKLYKYSFNFQKDNIINNYDKLLKSCCS